MHPARLAPDPAVQAYATLVPVCSTWTKTRRRVGPRAACPGRQTGHCCAQSASRKRGNCRSARLAHREALDRESSHKLRGWCLGQVSVPVVSTRAPTVAWQACGPRRSNATPPVRDLTVVGGDLPKLQDVSTGELRHRGGRDSSSVASPDLLSEGATKLRGTRDCARIEDIARSPANLGPVTQIADNRRSGAAGCRAI